MNANDAKELLTFPLVGERRVCHAFAIVLCMGLIGSLALSQESRPSMLNAEIAKLIEQRNYQEATRLSETLLLILNASPTGNEGPLAVLLNNVSVLADRKGSIAEAESCQVAALDIQGRRFGRMNWQYARFLNNLAQLFAESGRPVQAESLFLATLAIEERLGGRNHPGLSTSLENLGRLYLNMGHLHESELNLRRALSIRKGRLPAHSKEYCAALLDLARVLQREGRKPEAETLVRESIRVAVASFGFNREDAMRSLRAISFYYKEFASFDKALEMLERARARLGGRPELDRGIAPLLTDLAFLYARFGRHTDAVRTFEVASYGFDDSTSSGATALVECLSGLASVKNDDGHYSEAEILLQRCLTLLDGKSIANDRLRSSVINNLAYSLLMKGDRGKAQALFEAALAVSNTAKRTNPDQVLPLLNLAVLSSKCGNYAEARRRLHEAERITLSEGDSASETMARVHYQLASLYAKMWEFRRADSAISRSISIFTKWGGAFSEVQRAYVLQSIIGQSLGRTVEARDVARWSTEIAETRLGAADLSVLEGKRVLADIGCDLGEFAYAESLYSAVLTALRPLVPPGHSDLILATQARGAVLIELGRLDEGGAILREARDMWLANMDVDRVRALECSLRLGEALVRGKQYQEADSLLPRLRADAIHHLGPEHPLVALTEIELANLYERIGQPTRSEGFYISAIQVLEKSLGYAHPEVSKCYSNLGVLLAKQGRFAEARTLVERSLSIAQSNRRGSFLGTLVPVLTLAGIFNMHSRAEEAEHMFRAVESQLFKLLGQVNQYVATAENGIGYSCLVLERPSEAESHFRRCISMLDSLGYPDSTLLAGVLVNLAVAQQRQGDFSAADSSFGLSLAMIIREYERELDEASEKEGFSILEQLQGYCDTYNWFTLTRKSVTTRETAGVLANAQRIRGVLSRSLSSMIRSVRSNAEPILQANYAQWIRLRKSVQWLVSEGDAGFPIEYKSIRLLSDSLNRVERDLLRRTGQALLSVDSDRQIVLSIASALRTDEAAICIVRIANPVVNGFDSVSYAALIVRGDLKDSIQLVMLADGHRLEREDFWLYQDENSPLHQTDTIGSVDKDRIPSDLHYRHYWASVQARLKGIRKAFVSPDGVFNYLNIECLELDERRIVGDSLIVVLTPDLRSIVSDRRVIPSQATEKEAVLVAPFFESSDVSVEGHSELRKLNAEYSCWPDTARSENKHRELRSLRGAIAELEAVDSLLRTAGWIVRVYAGRDASEERISRITNPSILHVATHRFEDSSPFSRLPLSSRLDPTAGRGNPMLASGLLLAEAFNDSSKRRVALTAYDGILTPWEVMGLDLSKTQLVVLSACESGVGEIGLGEGIWGLPRSFLVAGARNILVSLWELDDLATSRFIQIFYQEWLASGELHSGLARARERARREQMSGRAWAAFVLVGAM